MVFKLDGAWHVAGWPVVTAWLRRFFPEAMAVAVAGAVRGVAFSQVRARVAGRAHCGAHAARCEGARVTLRALAPDGRYVGAPRYAVVAGWCADYSLLNPLRSKYVSEKIMYENFFYKF